jgi:hypothetical protein
MADQVRVCQSDTQVTDTWPMHACMHASSAQRAHHAAACARATTTSAAQGRPSDTLCLTTDALGRPLAQNSLAIHACMHGRPARFQMCGSPPARRCRA